MPLPLRFAFLLFAPGLFFAPACTVEPEEEPEIVVTVEPEFTVDLFERRDAADGHAEFGLWVESLKIFDYANYALETAVEVGPGRVEVRLLGIEPPAVGQGGPAALRQFIPIGPLPGGDHAFVLKLGPAIANEGRLSVGADRYELSIEKPQGVDFQQRVLRRLPDGLLWGFVRVPGESAKAPAVDLIEHLKPLTAEPALEPGFYGYFTLSGAGQIYFHRSFDADAPAAEPFVRRLSAPREAVRSLLDQYRHAQPDGPGLEVRCWTTEGEL